MNNNIRPHNENGQRHGYWEWYWISGNLLYKANYINDTMVGYSEDFSNNKVDGKQFYLI